MKNYSKNIEETLIAFHTGRGGRFNNAGCTTYVAQDKSINEFTHDLFQDCEYGNDVRERVQKNSILSRHFEAISEALANGAYGVLAEYGITKEEAGDLYYYTSGGVNVGLKVENDGTGTINEDYAYDTTTVIRLADADETEAKMILDSSNWKSADVIGYLEEKYPELLANKIFKLASYLTGHVLCSNNGNPKCLSEIDYENEDEYNADVLTFSYKKEAEEYISERGFYALEIIEEKQ